MGLQSKVARMLYRAVSSRKISFHTALTTFRPVAVYSARNRSHSGRFMIQSLIDHMLEATAPDARAAWTSVLFPDELLFPFGIHPLTLEVVGGIFSTLGLSSAFLDMAEASDVPPTMCSFHRILLGLSGSNFLEKPLLVGATSIMCDGNVKSFAEAAREQDVPFIFIDVPFEESEEGIMYLREQLESAVDNLAQLAKQKYSKVSLNDAIINANRAFRLARQAYALSQNSNKNLYTGHEAANFTFPMHYLLGSERLIKILEARCNDYSFGTAYNSFYKSLTYSDSVKRIMWLHIVPQYQTKIWRIIDDGIRARVVCDEYSAPYFEDYDFSDPLGSIARRLINHPSNGPLTRRIDHVLKVARDFKVDGIIHYSSWGCHQASGNVQILGKAIQDEGYRFLNLNGDAADQRNSSFEQHRTRLEAFLEH